MRTAPACAPRHIPSVFLVGASLAVLVTVGSGAIEEPVHEIRIGTDTVVGSIASVGEVRRVPFFLVEGATLDATLTAARGSPFHPRLVLLGPDRHEDAAATAAMERSPKGDRVTLAGYRTPSTGRRYFEVRSLDGSLGAFTLSSRCRFAKKASGSGSVAGGGDPAEFAFLAPGDAVGAIAVKAAAGSGAAPVFAGLTGPDGKTIPVFDVRPAGAGFSLRGVTLSLPGTYVLRVGSSEGTGGAFLVQAKWTTAKPVRRTLDVERIIADPVLMAVDPDHGNRNQTLEIALHVDFASPGAQVRFHRYPSILTVPPDRVTVYGDTASFTLDLFPLTEGTWDIEIVNPDEGASRLEDCFSVGGSPPQPQYVSPAFGYDDEVVRARVVGSSMSSGTTAALRLHDERIPGENAVCSSGSITADFDLRGRATGRWDVEVLNPGTDPVALLGAFEIRKAPVLRSMDPTDNLAGPSVEATILGEGFEPGSAVSLSFGLSDQRIRATDPVVVSPGEIRATFDTLGSPLGAFDLVLEYTGGRAVRLRDAFHTVGRPGPGVSILSLAPPGDAPVAATWNGTRDEYLVAWTVLNPKGWMVTWTVFVQRTDAAGTPLGTPVSVSTGPAGFPKGDVALGYDPARDEYLVAWAEFSRVTPTQNGQKHPNGDSPTVLAEVTAQRLKGADLTPVGTNLRVSDHSAFPASTATQWYLEDFDNFRPAVAFDCKRSVWEIAWMQAFDTSGLYSLDDYNVFARSLDPATGSLGTLVEVGVSPYHEGDPSVVWDDAGQRVVLALNARPGRDDAGLDVLLGSAGKYGIVARGGKDDLADPVAAVDPAAGRVLVTYTRISGADGLRTARAVLVDRSDLSTVFGEEAELSENTGESFHVRPVDATHLKRFLITWTEQTATGMSVRQRYADAAGSKGVVLVGAGEETSGGSTDEGISTVVYGPGEEAVFFLQTMSLTTRFVEYVGDEFATGAWAGGAIRLQRLK